MDKSITSFSGHKSKILIFYSCVFLFFFWLQQCSIANDFQMERNFFGITPFFGHLPLLLPLSRIWSLFLAFADGYDDDDADDVSNYVYMYECGMVQPPDTDNGQWRFGQNKFSTRQTSIDKTTRDRKERNHKTIWHNKTDRTINSINWN